MPLRATECRSVPRIATEGHGLLPSSGHTPSGRGGPFDSGAHLGSARAAAHRRRAPRGRHGGEGEVLLKNFIFKILNTQKKKRVSMMIGKFVLFFLIQKMYFLSSHLIEFNQGSM